MLLARRSKLSPDFRSIPITLPPSSLTLDKRKIFMLAVFQTEREKQELDQDIIAEASLSLDYPITVLIGSRRYTIGSKDEYLYKRLAIQAAIRRKRKAMGHLQMRFRIVYKNLLLGMSIQASHWQGPKQVLVEAH